MKTIRIAEMTDDDIAALYSYIEYEISCHVHDEAMTWDDFVETADSCIPDDWNGREIETDDDDYQELRGWAQDSLADFVDVIDDEEDDEEDDDEDEAVAE
jgi:hypothetical protein